jgi:hypothetical protein
MKNFTLTIICLFVLIAGSAKAQQQVNNSGFEDWENLGSATEEPTEWNSFKTGSGSLVLYTSQEIKRSTVVRPGTTGTYSCILWSKSTLSIVANGEVTTGQVNADNMAPSDPSNYNITHTAQPAFSEALGVKPDSMVIWVRYKPANAAGTDSARVHATIHDTYECKDPLDAASAAHVVAEAFCNFEATNGLWIRKSFPFIYSGPATSPDYILISITTNKTPGGGSAGDSLYVDDMELIYNDLGINNNNSSKNFTISSDANNILIGMVFDKITACDIDVYNISGQQVCNKKVNTACSLEKINTGNLPKGIYLIRVVTETGQRFSQKIAVK